MSHVHVSMLRAGSYLQLNTASPFLLGQMSGRGLTVWSAAAAPALFGPACWVSVCVDAKI